MEIIQEQIEGYRCNETTLTKLNYELSVSRTDKVLLKGERN